MLPKNNLTVSRFHRNTKGSLRCCRGLSGVLTCLCLPALPYFLHSPVVLYDWKPFMIQDLFDSHLVQVAQVILSKMDSSETILPEGTSCTCRV